MNAVLCSSRFAQLRDLAQEGNAEALGDLWLEFGFRMEGVTMNTAGQILQASGAATSDR
jgi:hypothetical protein